MRVVLVLMALALGCGGTTRAPQPVDDAAPDKPVADGTTDGTAETGDPPSEQVSGACKAARVGPRLLRRLTRDELRASVRAAFPVATATWDGGTLSPDAIEEGALVHVRSVEADGRIVLVGGQGRVTVDLDGVRVTTGVEDLSPPRGGTPVAPPPERRARVRRPRPGHVPLQLNVRGMTVSEALRSIDEYLDRLLRADIRRASILHGKGTGALRDAVGSYLGSCSFVASIRFAAPNLGGDGVTEFELAVEESAH